VRGAFVTGTDTGCGKTAVACAAARQAVKEGLRVRVIKPVETGCLEEGNRLRPLDALALADASADRSPLDEICPYRLRLAAAPQVAADAEGVEISAERIETLVRRAQGQSDLVIVEGAGGLFVPIGPGLDMADLAGRLGLPLLVVARAALGTINHTRLTLEAASRRGLPLLGVVISHTMPDLPSADRANLDLLRRTLGPRLLGELPHGADATVPPVPFRTLLSQSATC
jgi:dethiobiotin synthetase